MSNSPRMLRLLLVGAALSLSLTAARAQQAAPSFPDPTQSANDRLGQYIGQLVIANTVLNERVDQLQKALAMAQKPPVALGPGAGQAPTPPAVPTP